MKTKDVITFNRIQPIFRKVWLLLPIFLLIFAFSCRSDTEEQVEVQNDLIGLWQPYKFMQTATLSTGPYNQTTDYTICQQRSRIIFNESNGGTATLYGEENGACVQQSKENFTYSYNPATKVLSVTGSDGITQTGTVVRVTESELVYELTGVYDFQGETNVSVKTTIYARRTKD